MVTAPSASTATAGTETTVPPSTLGVTNAQSTPMTTNPSTSDESVKLVLTPFLGTCPGRQDKTAVFCLQEELPMRMVADSGEVERD